MNGNITEKIYCILILSLLFSLMQIILPVKYTEYYVSQVRIYLAGMSEDLR